MTSTCTSFEILREVGTAFTNKLIDSTSYELKYTQDKRTRERKWLLFQENSRGAIGKIVFSITEPLSQAVGGNKLPSRAFIKSVFINPQFRRLGLSRLLFQAVSYTLKKENVEFVELEAKEDECRHGKLVSLYSSWGFQVKKDARITWLYSDEQTFRKVLMILSAEDIVEYPVGNPQDTTFFLLSLATHSGHSIIGGNDGCLYNSASREASAPEGKHSYWQACTGGQNGFCFRSYYGKYLTVECNGEVYANRALNSTWETFEIITTSLGIVVRSFHGNFLTVDSEENRLATSSHPVMWGIESSKLICNTTTARHCTMLLRKFQTVAFVRQMKAKFLRFEHGSITLMDACSQLAKLHNGCSLENSHILKRMIYIGKSIQNDRHPIAMQCVGFLHGFGLLMLKWAIDKEESFLRSIAVEFWLMKFSSWITGYTIPMSIEYPELNSLNPENLCLSRQNRTVMEKTIPLRSLQDVEMIWSPDEYLFHLLKHNNTTLKEEELSMIRFRSFRVWFQENAYPSLETSQNIAILQKVKCFSKYMNPPMEKVLQVDVAKELPFFLEMTAKFLPETLSW